MRRLENEDEEKFWEAWIKDDLIFFYRYGKIGSAGATKLKKFKTRAEAEAELEQKLAEKLEEGFTEPGADGEEEEADEEEADEDEESDDDDDEEEASDDDDDEEDEESDDDDEEDEDDAPRKKGRATAPIVVEAPPAKPTLPVRVKPAKSGSTPAQVEAVVAALDALRAATAASARSWRLARLARRARHALEALGGAPLAEPASRALDAVMDAVIAPDKRLPLEDALTILWVVDVGTYARIVARWRATMLDSKAAPAIGVLAAANETIPDAEVAMHVGTALVNRRLSPDAFQAWFSRIKPFVVETGGFDAFRAALHPGRDAILKGRISEVSA